MGNKSSLMLQGEEIRQISEETGFTPSEIEKLYSRFSLLDRANCGTLGRSDLLSIPELAINPLCDRLLQIVFSDCDQEGRINFRQFARVLATFRSSATRHNSHSNLSGHLVNRPQTTTRQPNLSKIHPSARQRDHQDDRNPLNSPRELNNNTILAPEPRNNQLPSLKSNNNGLTIDGINDSLMKKLLFVFKVYDADDDGKISFSDIRSILKMMVGNYIEDYQLDKVADRVFAELDVNNDGFVEFHDFCQVFSTKDLNNKLRVKFVN